MGYFFGGGSTSGGLTKPQADLLYVKLLGDAMTGTLSLAAGPPESATPQIRLRNGAVSGRPPVGAPLAGLQLQLETRLGGRPQWMTSTSDVEGQVGQPGEGIYFWTNDWTGPVWPANAVFAGGFAGGQMVAPPGTLGWPGLVLGNEHPGADRHTGLFAPSGHTIAVAINSLEIGRFDSAGLAMSSPVAIAAGPLEGPTPQLRLRNGARAGNSTAGLQIQFETAAGGRPQWITSTTDIGGGAGTAGESLVFWTNNHTGGAWPANAVFAGKFSNGQLILGAGSAGSPALAVGGGPGYTDQHNIGFYRYGAGIGATGTIVLDAQNGQSSIVIDGPNANAAQRNMIDAQGGGTWCRIWGERTGFFLNPEANLHFQVMAGGYGFQEVCYMRGFGGTGDGALIFARGTVSAWDFITRSDEGLKANIEDLDPVWAENVFTQMRPITFEPRSHLPGGPSPPIERPPDEEATTPPVLTQIGLTANLLDPLLTLIDEDGFIGYSMAGVQAVLVSKIKTLEQRFGAIAPVFRFVGGLDAGQNLVTYTMASAIFPNPGPLVSPNRAGNGAVVVCVIGGTMPPAAGWLPGVAMDAGDQLISDGFVWHHNHASAGTALASNVVVTPPVFGSDNVQGALSAAETHLAARLPLAGGTLSGTLRITGTGFNALALGSGGSSMTIEGDNHGIRWTGGAGGDMWITKTAGRLRLNAAAQPQIAAAGGGNPRDIIDTLNGDARYWLRTERPNLAEVAQLNARLAVLETRLAQSAGEKDAEFE